MRKVAYLFGAGATQGVLKALDPTFGLMTDDIRREIRRKHLARPRLQNEVWNELCSDEVDIEHLISVMESQHNYSQSEIIRKYYRESLLSIALQQLANPDANNLYGVLLNLHKTALRLEEELISLVTLNYEDILERTIRASGFKVDYSLYSPDGRDRADAIEVLKLHGSFNWLNSRPIKIQKKMARSKADKSLWIPPGVDKRRDNYPFNLLWGRVTERLLECNVLRIVGCSLSHNDWGLIPILYTVQKFHSVARHDLEIEIIDYPKTKDHIKKQFRYIDVKGLLDIPEVIGYFKGQLSLNANEAELSREMQKNYDSPDKKNPFYDWLMAKISDLDSRSIALSPIASAFYQKNQ